MGTAGPQRIACWCLPIVPDTWEAEAKGKLIGVLNYSMYAD